MKVLKSFALFFVFAGALMAQAAHSVQLTWTPGTGGDPATGFNVKRSATTGGPYTTIQSTVAPTVTATDTNVVAGQTWFYVVTATNPGGESAPSGEASATIPFQAPSAPAKPTTVVK